MNLQDRIKQHEGFRRQPYECSAGFLTVGWGRNLEAVPFSDDELELMFENDFRRASEDAESLPGFEALNPIRQGVLIEMVFQMGLKGVSEFRKFIAAYQAGHWELAKIEMLDSKWHRQTPERAECLADIFFAGVWR